MPVKKSSKSKIVKKPVTKKAVKKPAKPASKAVKKPIVNTKKTPPKKVVKKSPPKKAVQKVVKKPEIKKAKIVTKKAVPQKVLAKKASTKKAPAKKTVAKKVAAKATKKEIANEKQQRANLAKSIMNSVSSKKPGEAVTKPTEKKNDNSQKIIVAKKSDYRGKVMFKVGDYAVYPSHGVGKIVAIEKTEVLGQDFSCYLMYFEKEKLTIKIPMNSAEKIGLRHPINKSQMDEVFVILRSGVKKLKGMWSRRAQEYETKINSGDITLLAEVLRDLTRDIEDGDRSYSERIIYETAIYRLASEYTVIYGVPFEEAKDKITLTAKDKLNSEGKIIQKDDFDDFDSDGLDKSELDEDEEENEDDEDEDEEGDEDDDDYDDDDDDDKPKKGRRR